MKRKFITFGALGLFIAIVFSSNQGGTYSSMGNRTGSNGNTSGCGSCHGAASSNVTPAIALMDGTTLVTEYEPGKTYNVIVSGVNSAGGHPKFGFQLTCGKAAAATTAAGTFGTNGVSGVALRASNTVVEQSTALAGTTSGTTDVYTRTFTWTAPATGTGEVKFFLVMNTVNGNGSDNGDNWNFATPISIDEKAQTNVADLQSITGISIYPNPIADKVQIAFENAVAGNYQFKIVDAFGRVISTNTVSLASGKQAYTIATEQLQAGNYYLHVANDNSQSVLKFQKL